MRKISASLMMVVYLAVSTGVMVNFHYCMNRLDATQLFSKKSETCSKCGMHTGTSKGCCRDEVKLVKITDDQLATTNVISELPPMLTMVHFPSAFFDQPFYNYSKTAVRFVHDPPLRTAPDTYIEQRVFRI